MIMSKHDIKVNDIEFFIYKDEKVWGDGEHETTKHMMDLIYKHGVKGKSVLEIGTGTGILSVLCGKLGAKSILAFDVDANALEWARKNFKHNEVNAEAEINNLADFYEEKVDVIIANLPAPIQVENVKTIAKNMTDDSLFIMSWWNKLKFEDYVRGFKVIEHIAGDDYDAYVLKKE